MAVNKLVDSTQLDSDLTSVANAIRAKGGTSNQLTFPAGFISAIGDIPSGQSGLPRIIPVGSFTPATQTNSWDFTLPSTAKAIVIVEQPDHHVYDGGNLFGFFWISIFDGTTVYRTFSFSFASWDTRPYYYDNSTSTIEQSGDNIIIHFASAFNAKFFRGRTYYYGYIAR